MTDTAGQGAGSSLRAVAGELSDLGRGATPERRHELLLVAASVVVLGLGVADLLDHYGIAVWTAIVVSALRAVAVVAMLRRPLTGWWLTLLACAATAAVTTAPDSGEPWPIPVSSSLTLAVALFVLTMAVRRTTAVVAWLGVLAVALLVGAPSAPSGASVPGSLLGTLVLTGLALVAGDAVAGRRRTHRRLAEVERTSVAERERRALLEERTRIAHDLHDVVAHHMSVVTVQADSAAYRIPDLDRRVAAEFTAIADGCRTALAEMRRMLDMLRTDPDDAAEFAPHAGLANLESLAENVRGVGAEVLLDVDAAVNDAVLRPEIELTAYRVVQEALSNVVRHAPGAVVHVSVRLQQDALRIHVTNGAGGVVDPVETSDRRRGLTGMRERVEIVGGSLSATPTGGGGFAVQALLPMAEGI